MEIDTEGARVTWSLDAAVCEARATHLYHREAQASQAQYRFF
jgi:hypothetical protein